MSDETHTTIHWTMIEDRPHDERSDDD